MPPRRVHWIAGIVPLLWVAACAGAGSPPEADPHVAVSLVNSGMRPLHCRLMFGHWVDRDLGFLAPGVSVKFAVRQQARDGALYIERADGLRRMMIENIYCGRDANWSASAGQVDLAPARSSRPRAIVASCALSAEAGRVACPPAGLQP